MTTSRELLRIKDVCLTTSLAKSTINLWVAQGRFPKPIALSPTLKVWRSQQIMDWIESLHIEPDPKADATVELAP